MRVLLTGSEGSIGRVLRTGLTSIGHEVIGADIAAGAEHTLDITDEAAVEALMADVRPDAVVHMAGIPTESGLRESLDSHVVSTGALLEAMVRHDVRRIVYASSNHAVGRTPRTTPGESVGIDTRPRPDTFYGVSKVAAEALLSLYADRHGLDAISCRIGSFLSEPETRRNLSTWLSHDDTVRMIEAALTAPSPGYAMLYGISANTRAWWDLQSGRALGYDPQDDAEEWAERIEATPESDDDHAEAAHVGGPYATDKFARPAFG